MIVIAESGSTKTNWLAQDGTLHETIGLNPLFHTPESVYAALQQHNGLSGLAAAVSAVYFYGASCSSPARKQVIADALQRYFTAAHTIQVDHDLKAAALATYTGTPGIACILGTGSNSCLYNGETIQQPVPALGYVLGDEGSGAYFGKKILSLFLYNRLPAATLQLLRDKYKVDKEIIFENVYKQPHANVYLARFAPVMSESPDTAFMQQLAVEGFTEFFEYHICCFENYRQYPVHFVGSIAHFYKNQLQQVAEKYGCQLGIIDRNPVHRLLQWHLANGRAGG